MEIDKNTLLIYHHIAHINSIFSSHQI